MAETEAATVRKQVVVDAPIERAFSLFTDRFGDFKPPEHNLLRAPIAETVFEGRVGGSIVDRALDGSECRWARILAFDPPDRVVFSWDISPQWTIETDQAQTSEVEVRFYAESPTRTRVELEHRHIDRHGPGWEAITDGVDGPEGWPLYLDRYVALVEEGSRHAAGCDQRRDRPPSPGHHRPGTSRQPRRGGPAHDQPIGRNLTLRTAGARRTYSRTSCRPHTCS